MKIQKILLFIVLLLASFITPTYADTLSVGTIERPPFMMEDDNGKLTGFSIELWEAVAEKLDLDYKFTPYRVFGEMIEDTKNSKQDLSIANISITSKREKEMDFSNPIFDSGLALMVKTDALKKQSLFGYLMTPGILCIFALLLVAPYVAYRFIPRKRMRKKRYIYLFLYILICTSVMSGVYTHYGISVTQGGGYNIGTLTGKSVGAIAGSTAESFLNEFAIKKQSFQTIDELYASLESGKSEVIVHDFPVLQYKAEQNTSLSVVGDTFKKEKYGILFPKGSDLKEDINVALLELSSEGMYEQIYTKYFGNN